jgi:hypothetical protein
MLAACGLLFCGTAAAQYQPNELLLHSGVSTWSGGPNTNGGYGFPNHGMGKYFPSFAHWPGEKFNGTHYPQKIAGWGWTAMQLSNTANTWFFSDVLHKSWDNPYDTTVYGTPPKRVGMPWDYPLVFCNMTVHSANDGALPEHIFGGVLPGLPALDPIGGTHGFIFPTTYNGDDSYWNIFALDSGTWVSATTPNPGYMWTFSLSTQCDYVWTIPSSHSVYEYVWDCRPETVVPQYLNISSHEYDCTGTAGTNVGNRMGRNYTIGGDYDNGKYWGWFSSIEAGYGLFMCDAIVIPVNVPGDPTGYNPYAAYGFDFGIATICPHLQAGCFQGKFCSLANQTPTAMRVVFGEAQFMPDRSAFPWDWDLPSPFPPNTPQCLEYNAAKGWRIPHYWISLAYTMLNYVYFFMHATAPGYPAYFFNSCAGGHTNNFPLPAFPQFHCLEAHFSTFSPFFGTPLVVPPNTYPPQPDGPPSASFMLTFW